MSAAITVLGAGSYGTALAICLARNGHQTLLWGRSQDDIQAMRQDRVNHKYLPDIRLPEALAVTEDLVAAVQASQNVLVVVPSHAFADTLKQIKPYLLPHARVAWATKGLEPETGRLLQDVARDILGDEVSLAVLSGRPLPKNWHKGYPRRFRYLPPMLSLLPCCRTYCIAAVPSGFIPILILLACSSVAR